MRLIDADALIEDLETEFINLKMDGLKGTPRSKELPFKEIVERVNEQPTVKEHKHGHWIQVSDWDKDANAHFDCSVCGFGDKHGDDVVVPYCWHCGAVMDEVAEDK